MIEALGESFEIDIGGVDVAKNLGARLRGDITRSDHDALNAALACEAGNIADKFAPNDRIVIGEGDAGNAAFDGQVDDLFGTRLQATGLVELGLADAPVLTETTTQVAAGGAEAQDFTAGKEMVERSFFDRIDGEARLSAVAERIEPAADILADIAKPGLTIGHAAITRAKGAEQSAIVFPVPPARFVHAKNIPLFNQRRKGREICISAPLCYI